MKLENARLPNFLVIGAAKAGTTSLYRYLEQHPDIFMCRPKEPHFFSFDGKIPEFSGPGDRGKFADCVVTLKDYQNLFSDVTHEKAVGEASTSYLSSPLAAWRIHQTLPRIKIIAILRNPVERAFSQYQMMVRRTEEPLRDFRKALRAEEKRHQAGWYWGWQYIERGKYAMHLDRYFKIFRPEQMRIYLYEEWNSDNHLVLCDMFNFLEVDENFVPDVGMRMNTGGLPKNYLLQRFLFRPHWLKSIIRPLIPPLSSRRLHLKLRKVNVRKAELASEIRSELIEVFRPDIIRLQDMLGRDLSAWLV